MMGELISSFDLYFVSAVVMTYLFTLYESMHLDAWIVSFFYNGS